ncbi:MAG: JAB domain-containing protein [Limnochordia bacterium]
MRYLAVLLLFSLISSFALPQAPPRPAILNSARDAYHLAYLEIGALNYEKALIYFVDGHGHLLKVARAGQRIADGIYYVPWELVLPHRLPQGTKTIYLVHNHPGNNPQLSREDIGTGQFWAHWAEQLGITFDLLAITPQGDYRSLREGGHYSATEADYGLLDLMGYLIPPSLAMAGTSLRRVLFLS